MTSLGSAEPCGTLRRNGACCVRIKTRRAVKVVSVRGDKTRCGQMRFQLQNARCSLVGTSNGHRMSRNGLIHGFKHAPESPRSGVLDDILRPAETHVADEWQPAEVWLKLSRPSPNVASETSRPQPGPHVGLINFTKMAQHSAETNHRASRVLNTTSPSCNSASAWLKSLLRGGLRLKPSATHSALAQNHHLEPEAKARSRGSGSARAASLEVRPPERGITSHHFHPPTKAIYRTRRWRTPCTTKLRTALLHSLLSMRAGRDERLSVPHHSAPSCLP